jgi:hypothetical protein
MHLIEPYDRWRDLYAAEEDPRSPFYGRIYSETECHNTIYNYYIHPQWDEFGSSTLYCKIIFADYREGYAVIELMGEWNDCIYNDIMYLKRDLADALIEEGITKFILIGENVLNFHYSDESYYEEWFDDVEDGWIVLINFRDHVLQEMKRARIDYYVMFGALFQQVSWRKLQPQQLYRLVSEKMSRLIG